MRLYVRVAWFNFGTYWAYPFELAAAVLRPAVEFGLRALFWSAVALGAPGTVDFRTIMAYLLVASGVSSLTLMSYVRYGSWLGKSIKFGDINHELILPVNVLGYYLAAMIGSMGVSFGLAALFVVIGWWLVPPASWLGVGLFGLHLVLAIVIAFSINVLVGSIAFYTTEVAGFKNVVSHIANVFSGAIVPLSLFPGVLQVVALSLPFAAVVYGPVNALRLTAWTSAEAVSLVVAVGWAVTLLPLALWTWQRSMRRYEAVGL